MQVPQFNCRGSWQSILLIIHAILLGHLEASLLLIQDPPLVMKRGRNIKGWNIYLPCISCDEM